MALYPAVNDALNDLWKKIAWNTYEMAVTAGVTGLTPPNWNETTESLQRKCAYYTASVLP
jgi:hypothetical protein